MLNQECHSGATPEDITGAGNLRKHFGQRIEMGGGEQMWWTDLSESLVPEIHARRQHERHFFTDPCDAFGLTEQRIAN